jgi:hypothetical protein
MSTPLQRGLRGMINKVVDRDATTSVYSNSYIGTTSMDIYKCKGCEESKPADCFPKDYRNKNNLNSKCKDCERKRKRKNRRFNKMLVDCGATHNLYEKLLEEQKGACAICGTVPSESERSLCLDHCHSKNKIRGLLCHKCNRILGQWNDNIDTLESAIFYLKQNQ